MVNAVVTYGADTTKVFRTVEAHYRLLHGQGTLDSLGRYTPPKASSIGLPDTARIQAKYPLVQAKYDTAQYVIEATGGVYRVSAAHSAVQSATARICAYRPPIAVPNPTTGP